MALSGHKDISMLKRYSHTHEEAKRASISKLSIRYANENRESNQEGQENY